jgi:hypothetical protein
MGLDLDNWIERVKKAEYLTENELKSLCDYVSWGTRLLRKPACFQVAVPFAFFSFFFFCPSVEAARQLPPHHSSFL